MQMEDSVHLRLQNRIKVHQVTMVWQKVVIGAASPFAVRMKRPHIEIEYIAREHRVNSKRAINVERITCRLGIPPGCSTPYKKRHKDQAAHSSPNRSPSAVRRRNRTRLKANIADRCGYNPGHAHNQEQAEDSEHNAESALHLQGRDCAFGNPHPHTLLSRFSPHL